MGTLQNRLIWVSDYCLSVRDWMPSWSLWRFRKSESLPNLLGNPLVVEYAPQLELLEKRLMITHAGMNDDGM